ncbi:unnamed protein product [Hermetia illucens]|uniref:MADF domain-containing protein n=1 Tax=Hermetia illucens TaxID=343691 RepID=A0A7R8UYT9_HERIL|nr:unnamed protein product [Hermetia illucens]
MDRKNRKRRSQEARNIKIEFETMLIMEVESRQCLYAKDKEDYKNKTKREDAWKDIFSILNRSECQSKWNILRDSFRSYYRSLCNTPSGSGATETVKWPHFKAMMFLIPYIRVPEDDCGNYSNNSPNYPLIRFCKAKTTLVTPNTTNQAICLQIIIANEREIVSTNHSKKCCKQSKIQLPKNQ